MISKLFASLELILNFVFSVFRKTLFWLFVMFLLGVSIATTAFILAYNITK